MTDQDANSQEIPNLLMQSKQEHEAALGGLL